MMPGTSGAIWGPPLGAETNTVMAEKRARRNQCVWWPDMLLFSRQVMSNSSKPLSPIISGNLPKFISVASVMPSNHLVLCHPLLLQPSVFVSIRVFSSELAVRIRWAKYWSFSISPSNEYLGFISFKIDWFDLLATQGTLKCLLQYHNSKASIPWCSAFFMVQL